MPWVLVVAICWTRALAPHLSRVRCAFAASAQIHIPVVPKKEEEEEEANVVSEEKEERDCAPVDTSAVVDCPLIRLAPPIVDQLLLERINNQVVTVPPSPKLREMDRLCGQTQLRVCCLRTLSTAKAPSPRHGSLALSLRGSRRTGT